jgi:hypothetical protein
MSDQNYLIKKHAANVKMAVHKCDRREESGPVSCTVEWKKYKEENEK